MADGCEMDQGDGGPGPKRPDSIDASMCDGDEKLALMNIPDGIDDVIDIPYA